MSSGSASAQSGGGLWSGHLSCQVDVQSDGYEHHEIQTWTLTGGAPLPGGIPAYPATWSVTGQGSARQVLGAPPGKVSWKSHVAPMNSAIAIFVRPSDNRLVFLPRTRLVAPGGHSGTRQLAGGTTQDVRYTASEWAFPAIADAAGSTQTIGSGTTVVTGGVLPAHAVSGTAVANCSWEFSKSGDASTAGAESASGARTGIRPGVPLPVGSAPTGASRTSAAPSAANPAPQSNDAALLQVSPRSVMRGAQKVSVTITGRSTHFDQKTTTVMVGAGLFVSVESVTVSSPTSLTANLNVSKASGMRPQKGTNSFLVVVSTGSETVQLYDAFRVTSPYIRVVDKK